MPPTEMSAQESGHCQNEEHMFNAARSIRRLKIIMAQGYDHFAALYSVQTS